MKIGLTSYSMNNYICDGLMSVCEVMRFAKEKGAEHIELVPFGFTLHDDRTGEFNEPLILYIKSIHFFHCGFISQSSLIFELP